MTQEEDGKFFNIPSHSTTRKKKGPLLNSSIRQAWKWQESSQEESKIDCIGEEYGQRPSLFEVPRHEGSSLSDGHQRARAKGPNHLQCKNLP